MLLYIIGRNPTLFLKNTHKKAIITGQVENIRKYLNIVKIYVIPMRIGNGRQNKILEAKASGLPVVATSTALEEIIAAPGKEIIIADTPEEFAANGIKLLSNAIKRTFISRNARRYVERYHNWKINLESMDHIFKQFVTR